MTTPCARMHGSLRSVLLLIHGEATKISGTPPRLEQVAMGRDYNRHQHHHHHHTDSLAETPRTDR
ncbi:hypothetical protein ANCDUO_00431 [Ancylostoma duodenale]|uniref:Uncharacterized protein n=1 Tax=Ancylostoma duodenale TaxID=51022 RepID=A0A0C2HC38_9BILA|nr:hypothetical protein ANCDUO_00431 [Ancylostoma duodenale]